jgi:hypothetical protein
MPLPNIFTREIADQVIRRIHALQPGSQPLWGKMTADQMLAHCCVTYEMLYENKHPKPNFFMKFILKTIVKKYVTGDAPYKHNSKTAPAFIINGSRNYEGEKIRLIDYINKTQQLGEVFFEYKESVSFGILSKNEWNNMFYKHLDHHLQQFGV